jgi:NO-binding membrane sensor protein with MHYT domain
LRNAGAPMLQVYNCLTDQHDWRLVGVAAVICLFASLTTINIFNRARATEGRTRAVWIVAAGVAAGFGIWATHFVAMMAYEPGVTIAFGIALTSLSLAAAVATVMFALSIAVYVQARWAPPLSGALVGGGIAAMHYMGMFAVSIPGLIQWQLGLVALSIALGMLFGALAMAVAVRSFKRRDAALAALLLTLAIVSHHFTAMGAVEIVPDPARTIGALSLSPGILGAAIAGGAMAILGIALTSAFAGRRLDEKSSFLTMALNNLSQGVVIFTGERLVFCNERFLTLYRLPADVIKPGCTLTDIFRIRAASNTSGAIRKPIARICLTPWPVVRPRAASSARRTAAKSRSSIARFPARRIGSARTKTSAINFASSANGRRWTSSGIGGRRSRLRSPIFATPLPRY